MSTKKKTFSSLPPTILTIFGATGDLSADYLLPAIFSMDMHGLLPEDFKLVAVGRRDMNTKEYLNFIIKKSAHLKPSPKQKAHFIKHLLYYRGDLDDPESFKKLAEELSDKDAPKHQCYNRLFYFATSPQLFASITHVLKESGLLMSCSAHDRETRVLVEKPFGFNEASAKDLNKLLLKYFSEKQIYRIDHYLGKETVQNLMVVRFANSLFEPLWNAEHIDHIEMSMLYDDKVGSRAEYFEQAGIIKDIVQNHALQMLALLTMDEPKDLTAGDIRNEKLKVLQALQSTSSIVRAQYQGYKKEVKNMGSTTETYVAMKAFINTPRWKNVPMYIRTGMGMAKKVTEISVHFKEPLRCLFKGCASNVLTFRIQPNESVHLRLNNKVPGFGMELHQGNYEFGYKNEFTEKIPPAYERLLLDFMQGDQRLFIRSDEIEAAWKFVDSITSSWSKLPLTSYKTGTLGPREGDKFIAKENREWFTK